jgi:hypothetical protein
MGANAHHATEKEPAALAKAQEAVHGAREPVNALYAVSKKKVMENKY